MQAVSVSCITSFLPLKSHNIQSLFPVFFYLPYLTLAFLHVQQYVLLLVDDSEILVNRTHLTLGQRPACDFNKSESPPDRFPNTLG